MLVSVELKDKVLEHFLKNHNKRDSDQGASQVGIYPQDSPGGWHVIGNCPIPLMDFEKTPPNLVQAGNRIQFFAISKEEHQAVLLAIENKNEHPLINQVSND